MKEIIVVEGKNDYHAVKRAVPEAEVIITSGYGLNNNIMEKIKTAHKNRGVIVLTDPDHMGEIIRKRIEDEVPGVKHCYIPKINAVKNNDIGIENSTPEVIIKALQKLRTVDTNNTKLFNNIDLMENNLIGTPKAQNRREKLGALLGIGYGNSKAFLKRLNTYGISRKEFYEALKAIDHLDGGENNGKPI